jgi:hypothetical protein
MAENEPLKAPLQQTADQVPPEAIATPPTWIPDRETPEARVAREAEGLPEPPPPKLPKPPGAPHQRPASEEPHKTATARR